MQVLQTNEAPVFATALEQAVRDIDQLETIPAIAQRLVGVSSDPESSLVDVEKVVSADVGLTAKILSVANSPYYSRGRPAKDLREALMRVGMRDIQNIGLASIMSQKGKKAHPALSQLWAYSLRCGIYAEELSRGLNGIKEPFLCGLLHEIGTLVMSKLKGADYWGLIEHPGSPDQKEREQASFEIDHCDLGAMVGARWDFFDELECVIQFHHNPFAILDLGFDPSAIKTVQLVALARIPAFRSQLDDPERNPEAEQQEALLRVLGMDPTLFEAQVLRAAERFDQIAGALLG